MQFQRLFNYTFCIHGNHEERTENISSYKVKIFHDGIVCYEEEYTNRLFVKDGEVYEFNNHKVLVIGGAYNVDKYFRLERGYDWYESEQLHEEIKKNIFSDEIAKTLVTQLSWTNNLLILNGSKVKEERYSYLQLSIKENYSKRELDRQITSAYYERYLLSEGNLPSTNKIIDEDDYLDTRILDLYSLEFLDQPNEYSENDLKTAIVKNLKNFILEVGKDFTFIGDEYRVQVGNHDLFIDLLFFNCELSCLVAFELKLGEFKAEYLGKMNLYLEALDRDVKKKNENPSVGVILCSSKDKNIVEYSLSKNMSQTLISEYKLKLIDKKLLENKLSEMNRILENEN